MKRRTFLVSAAAAQAQPKPVLIESHLHLFDPQRFPYHAKASYKPPAETLDTYVKLVREAGLTHSVIVHPEPYQDDHSYLEYCFANEPSPGFFKGTCLFDGTLDDTPARMAALVKKNPGRIVALRVHTNRAADAKPTTGGPIRDRDLKHPNMRKTWRAAHDLGLAIQLHFTPVHAPQLAELAAEFRDTPVILDHYGRSGQGTPAQFEHVMAMAKLPKVIMKFSGVRYSSSQDAPHSDVKLLTRRIFDSFGPDRMIWGGLGSTMEEHRAAAQVFEEQLAFASAGDRAKIRGLSAKRLFRF